MRHINILKIVLFLLCSFAYTTVIYAQQDSQYTQYMYNTETINPAYAGTRGSLNFMGLYRNQWVGLDGAPKTLNFSVNTPVRERVGLGITFSQDKIGPSDESTIAMDFSYTLPVNEDIKFAFGIKGGINLLNVDYTILTIENPTDNEFQYNIDNRVTPIIGAGAYLYNETWYAGFSVPNMLETTHYDDSTISNASEKPNFYAIAGYVFTLSDSVKLKPAVLGKFTSGAPIAIDISANVLFLKKFTLGVSYRLDASISALAGFQITDTFFAGYSYDYDTTGIGNYNSGSHEIFLRLEIFKTTSRMVSPRFF